MLYMKVVIGGALRCMHQRFPTERRRGGALNCLCHQISWQQLAQALQDWPRTISLVLARVHRAQAVRLAKLLLDLVDTKA